MANMLPIARSPMDKKSGQAIEKYRKEFVKGIEKEFTPWTIREVVIHGSRSKNGLESGEVKVQMEAHERDLLDDLFKDAEVM